MLKFSGQNQGLLEQYFKKLTKAWIFGQYFKEYQR